MNRVPQPLVIIAALSIACALGRAIAATEDAPSTPHQPQLTVESLKESFEKLEGRFTSERDLLRQKLKDQEAELAKLREGLVKVGERIDANQKADETIARDLGQRIQSALTAAKGALMVKTVEKVIDTGPRGPTEVTVKVLEPGEGRIVAAWYVPFRGVKTLGASYDSVDVQPVGDTSVSLKVAGWGTTTPRLYVLYVRG
jgi:hypothetical protein